MRGIFIQAPLELRIAVEGDTVIQGDTLRCILTVKNHSSQEQQVANLRLELVEADLKKVKKREADAFSNALVAVFAPATIAPNQQSEFPWSFVLEPNCVVSDKSQSLYLMYGVGDGIPGGQLPVTVLPHPHLRKIFEILESAFQFVLKDITSSKGWLMGRFKPPSARQFGLVDELVLKLKRIDQDLVVEYEFKVKRFDTELSSVSVKKSKSTLEQRWSPVDYLLGGEHLNYEAVDKKLQEALSTVATPM